MGLASGGAARRVGAACVVGSMMMAAALPAAAAPVGYVVSTYFAYFLNEGRFDTFFRGEPGAPGRPIENLTVETIFEPGGHAEEALVVLGFYVDGNVDGVTLSLDVRASDYEPSGISLEVTPELSGFTYEAPIHGAFGMSSSFVSLDIVDGVVGDWSYFETDGDSYRASYAPRPRTVVVDAAGTAHEGYASWYFEVSGEAALSRTPSYWTSTRSVFCGRERPGGEVEEIACSDLPAPVPLPAAGGLLAAGLGALAAASVARRGPASGRRG